MKKLRSCKWLDVYVSSVNLIYRNIRKEFLFNKFAGGYFNQLYINYLIKDTNLAKSTQELIDNKINITITDDKTRDLASPKLTTIENTPIEEYIIRDIIILQEKNILTSRLSIAIYRKAMLDINANVTEIGRYYSKLLGQRSKSVNLKKICNGTSIDYDGLTKIIVKAYDLNIKEKSQKMLKYELELEIKENIAKKLLYFTNIDIDTIQRIVELPQSTLKKYR